MTDFEQACLEAAEAFLQTVVLLDDQAAFTTAEDDIQDGLVEPDEDDMVSTASGEEEQGTLARFRAEGLDAGAITSGFAARGFICAVLRPDQGGSDDVTLKAAERADVVVLDWEMGDKGTKATEIIKRLHDKDHGNGDRLRLVVIYTGANPLRDVAAKLAANLTGFKVPVNAPGTGLVFENATGTTRLIILAKTAAHNAPEEANLAVSDRELPGRIITEFAHFAGGLLPNATLASIAALRSHTHKVLSRLDKRLDGPLLTHRTLVDSADAEQFVATLIMEELESQVPLPGISRKFFGKEAVRTYLKHREAQKLSSKFTDLNGRKRKLNADEASGLIEYGVSALSDDIAGYAAGSKQSRDEFNLGYEKNLHKKLYHLIEDDKPLSEKAHERLAVISGMARGGAFRTEEEPGGAPILKLGTVLSSEGRYWVCVTPLCDCVRIPDEGGRFLLVELVTVKADRPWSVIVEEDGVHVKLLIEKKRPNLATVLFNPSPGRVVRATIQDMDVAARSPDHVEEGATKKTAAVRTDSPVAKVEAPTAQDDESTAVVIPIKPAATAIADAAAGPSEAATMNGPDATSDVSPKPQVAVFYEAPRPDGQVAATYRWLGEMKAMQAQRVVQNFASNVARVGLDEFDWQRRQAPTP